MKIKFTLPFFLAINLQCLAIPYKNVCNKFSGYLWPDLAESCYHDPDTSLEVPAVIEKYTASLETHQVVSPDGYILTLFRILRQNPRGVILFHHSISLDSRIYLWDGNDSLAVTLWRLGFDVWLANHRGTKFSNTHINLTQSDFQYWNFSLYEMGVYDISAEIEHIRQKTNESKIIYIGHSLGCMTGIAYSSIKSQEAKDNLKAMVLVAAPSYYKYTTSIIVLVTRFEPVFRALSNIFQVGGVLSFLPVLLPILKLAFRVFPPLLSIVVVAVWALCGFTPEETNPRFFNYDVLLYGDNFSWHTFLHLMQLRNANHRYQSYDYGKGENLKVYGTEEPPLFPIGNIVTPVLMVSSYNDTLVALKDCEDLYEELSSEAKQYGHWKINGLNHLDYLFGIHRKKLFANNLIEFLTNL